MPKQFAYTQPLEDTLKKHVEAIIQELKARSAVLAQNRTLRSFAKATPLGLVGAFIEFLPNEDPTEEAISFCISLQPEDTALKFTIDICYSDGPVLAELHQSLVPPEPIDELVRQVDRRLSEIRDATVKQLVEIADSKPKRRMREDPWPPR